MGDRLRGVATILTLALGGCALAGPVFDTAMDEAPYRACYRFGSAEGPPQCLALVTEGRHVSGEALAAGRLAAGDVLRGALSPAPGCPAAFFTHLTVAGDSPGPGAMRVEAHDAVGRGAVGETFRWDEPRAGRTWVVDGISTPLLNPASFSIAVGEGEVRLSEICFASYER